MTVTPIAPPPNPYRVGWAMVGSSLLTLAVSAGALVVAEWPKGHDGRDAVGVVATSAPVMAVDVPQEPPLVVFVMATDTPAPTATMRPAPRATATKQAICETWVPGGVCRMPEPMEPTPTPFPLCPGPPGGVCAWPTFDARGLP